MQLDIRNVRACVTKCVFNRACMHCVPECVHAYIYICVCINTCKYIYIYIYIYIYVGELCAIIP